MGCEVMKYLILILLIPSLVFAGLPPTSTKFNGESNFSTTFNFDFSIFSGSHSGVIGTPNYLLPIGGGTGLTTTPTNGQTLIGNGTGYSLNTLTPTANQTTVTNGVGTITLGTVQDIATTSSPTFASPIITGDVILANAQFNNMPAGHAIAYNLATGVTGQSILSINANPALFDISIQNLSFSSYSTNVNLATPVIKDVDCPAQAGLTLTNLATADSTYISVTDACTILQSTTFPSPQDRRTNAFIGRISHPNRTSISSVSVLPDLVVDTNSQLYDLYDAIGAFNITGNILSPNGVNLSFNRSAGTIFRRSANYATNVRDPHEVSIAGTTPQTFLRATQTTINTTPINVVDITNYDVAGTVTAIPGGSPTSTNQRVFLFSNGVVGVQYGQVLYNNLSSALAGISSEAFTINPQAADGGILIGIVSCRKDATDLSDTNQCVLTRVSRFDQTGTSAGSASTTTLQQAYLNSVQPQITLNTTQSGVQIRDASTPIAASLFAIQNNAGSTSYLGVDVNGITATNFVGTGTTGAVRVHNLTTTEKNALTGANGMIVYDTTLNQMQCYVNGSWGQCVRDLQSSDLTLTASDTLAISLTHFNQTWLVQGNAAAITMSTLPFGSSDPIDGAEIDLIGNSDTNTVTFVTNDAANGIIGYGFTLYLGKIVTVKYKSSLDRWLVKSSSN